jgi:hypothetical protein
MPPAQRGYLERNLHVLFNAGAVGGLTDDRLLERYVRGFESRDQRSRRERGERSFSLRSLSGGEHYYDSE